MFLFWFRIWIIFLSCFIFDLFSLLLLLILYPATSISCYVCNATDSNSPFQCGEWFERYDMPDIQPHDCSNVYGAKYCIKHIGRFEGNNDIAFIFPHHLINMGMGLTKHHFTGIANTKSLVLTNIFFWFTFVNFSIINSLILF